MSTYRRGVKGYKLYCNDNMMQLFIRQRGDTFIFLNRPPEESGADIVTSWALQKLSGHARRVCGSSSPNIQIDNRCYVAIWSNEPHSGDIPRDTCGIEP